MCIYTDLTVYYYYYIFFAACTSRRTVYLWSYGVASHKHAASGVFRTFPKEFK